MAIAIVTMVSLGFAGTASAHAQLESTQPDEGSVLATSPSQVVLHFGEPVEIDFGSIRVIGPKGDRVDEGGTHHPPGDSHSVAISLPAHLAEGTYIVAWRVISADSHPVHGAFIFSVGTAGGAGKANALATSIANTRGSDVVGVTFWLVRFAAFASLLLLIGVTAMITLIWPPGGSVRRIACLLWASWATLAACSVAGVALQGVYAASLPLTDIVRPTLFNEVLHTRFGEIEILRIVLLVTFLPVIRSIGTVRSGSKGIGWLAYASVIAVGLLLTPGLAGHASTGSDPLFGTTLDVLHLGAAGVWIGGLAVLAASLLPGLPPESRPGDLHSVAMRFSAFAFAAVMIVVATGVIQSIRQVGSFYALFNTAYGVTLCVKVGFVVLLVALGAISRRIVLGAWLGPRMTRRIGTSRKRSAAVELQQARPEDDGTPRADGSFAPRQGLQTEVMSRPRQSHLRLSVCSEIAISLVVLAVTALLVNAEPAKQAANQPYSQSFTVLGVQINAIVSPGKTGSGNQFHFYILGRKGEPVAIPELDAAMSLPSEGIGPLSIPLTVATVGHFRATDVDIPLAGNWRLTITVRTSPIDEQEIYATLPIR